MLQNLAGFSRDRAGSVVVEFAFYAAMLTLMLIGVLDFGLAYAREMTMTNAVRAGTQFALARHPVVQSDALISVQQIRDAVVDATPFLSTDPGTTYLNVAVLCDCDDNTQVTCQSLQATPGACVVEAVYVQVELSYPYELTLTFPGMDPELTLETEHVIRIL
jgi:Flp pilus assembly protein TadG